MNVCTVMSAVINGVDAVPVSVEVAVANGIPGMCIVGMANTAVQEARERIRSAIQSVGFSVPSRKLVINLAPGEMRKKGSGLDLPMALGVLVATGQIDPKLIKERLFAGELSLSGEVRSVPGDLAYAICARKLGYEYVSGGGNPIGPGEVALAHNGVLFLDELAEFKPSTLQALRQPTETKDVRITRVDSIVVMPASFMLIAASNPCPCGYFGDEDHECTCTSAKVMSYRSRVGGPLLDRMSIQLDVSRLPASSVLDSGSGISSGKLREGVMRAIEFEDWRTHKQAEAYESAIGLDAVARTMTPVERCRLDDEASKYIATAADGNAISGRGIISILNVARTIADMEESQEVRASHIAEALGYRLSIGDDFKW